jgi:RND family efflux transporter MFP subunit
MVVRHKPQAAAARILRSPLALLRMSFTLLAAALLSACKEDNPPVTPPPPKVAVAQPLQRPVTPYLEATGSVVVINSADLVARVPGYLTAIAYRDGDAVKRGTTLFTIEPVEYQAKLQQAQAALASNQAQLVQADAELDRQVTLGRQTYAAQSTIDQARALRDGLRATINGQQAGVMLAQLDLGYTNVVAPFDGVVSARLLSIGSLVGVGGPTRLATIVQLDPIYVSFTISEQDAPASATSWPPAA